MSFVKDYYGDREDVRWMVEGFEEFRNRDVVIQTEDGMDVPISSIFALLPETVVWAVYVEGALVAMEKCKSITSKLPKSTAEIFAASLSQYE